MISLEEIVSKLDEYGDELVMYVSSTDDIGPSAAVLLIDEEAERVPEDARYFLEVSIAREVLGVWAAWRGGRKPTIIQACDALIYYAARDAYIPAD
jgi:hypothetical protein